MTSRRKFIRTAALASAGIGLGLPATACASGKVIGANRSVNAVVFGTNGRGVSLTQTFANAKDCNVIGIGDVDTRAIEKGKKAVMDAGGAEPKGEQDFRRFLDDKDVDVVVIATPDHWHAPMAIMALQAGKAVYVEKPCSHNPAEGDILVAAQRKYGHMVQMGNQTRSSVSLNRVVKEIHDGLIGKAYAGKAWYSNTRGPIGKGKKADVPEWLDWELWQGPAPRQAYMDNVVHYNWHWFHKWGTGEILNNGTHEIDMCRWALEVGYPNKVTSTGGRYHFQDDDWQFYDTQLVGYEYEGGKSINWDGKSANGMTMWDRGRGAFIHGTEGSVLMERSGYTVYDLKGKEIRTEREAGDSVDMGVTGGGSLDELHVANFIGAINGSEKLNSPIEEGNVSVTTCHLGNIAQRCGGLLALDTQTGKPVDDAEAMKLWDREYAEGWEVKV